MYNLSKCMDALVSAVRECESFGVSHKSVEAARKCLEAGACYPFAAAAISGVNPCLEAANNTKDTHCS